MNFEGTGGPIKNRCEQTVRSACEFQGNVAGANRSGAGDDTIQRPSRPVIQRYKNGGVWPKKWIGSKRGNRDLLGVIGLTAMFGSLSWLVSPLRDLGMTLTIFIIVIYLVRLRAAPSFHAL